MRKFDLLLAIAAIVVVVPPRDLAAHPHIRRWEYKATITFLVDDFEVFGDVRTGDLVLGTIGFDSTAVGEDSTRPSYPNELRTSYAHAPQFPLVTLAIENPRLDEVAYYGNDENDELFLWDNVVGGWFGPGVDGDWMLFSEDLIYPYDTEWWGLTAEVWFEGLGVISETALPDEIVLDDWSTATVELYDAFADAYITAEIYELTPIEAPFIEGDFNGDSAVDARDLSVWRWANGSINANLAADADGDGVVNGGDFLTWQREFGVGAESLEAGQSVPEPAGGGLTAVVAALWYIGWTRHATRRDSTKGMRSWPRDGGARCLSWRRGLQLAPVRL